MDQRQGSKRLRLALIGSRGIPACYGGYETLMEELAPRLVQHGFDVTVYCRSHYTPRGLREHRGVRLVVLPTLRTKHLDTPVHTLLACLHSARAGYDAAIVVNAANALFLPILRLGRIPAALHVDGMERHRAKWGRFGRSVYRASEWLACRVADRLITDAEVIRELYLERHRTESVMIPYGSDLEPPTGSETLDRLGLEPGRYLLYVSRFEPENNPHRVVEAYRVATPGVPLVMLGDAPYADEFIRGFRREEPGVLYPGAIYGDGYRQLQSRSLAYVHATEVGGTHPALVEAMGYGNCVLVHDTPENREVAGDAALYFDAREPVSLAALMQRVATDPALVADLRAKASARARERYSWDRVSADYAELVKALASSRGG
jgi:glycosyltransferase involved in cell wall biosynthesis